MTDADKTIYKICREQAGYTQERAAELLNCSVRQLARYEAGVKRPSVENLTKLADVLETSTDAILGRNTA
jgi:transcriptional regulator with XRE-family HTH domain